MLPCLIIMIEEVKSLKKRQLRILVVALEKPRTQPNYAYVAVHGYTDDQQMPPSFTGPTYCNWSCGSDGDDGGPYNYGYMASSEPH